MCFPPSVLYFVWSDLDAGLWSYALAPREWGWGVFYYSTWLGLYWRWPRDIRVAFKEKRHQGWEGCFKGSQAIRLISAQGSPWSSGFWLPAAWDDRTSINLIKFARPQLIRIGQMIIIGQTGLISQGVFFRSPTFQFLEHAVYQEGLLWWVIQAKDPE